MRGELRRLSDNKHKRIAGINYYFLCVADYESQDRPDEAEESKSCEEVVVE